MTQCKEPGCWRKPTYPDQAYCETHRLSWSNRQPEWLRRMRETGLPAKDMTRTAA